MQNRIKELIQESIDTKRRLMEDGFLEIINECANQITSALKQGKKVLLAGNGGSAADCQHIAAEFIGRFQKERVSLPAIALTTDTSALTAIGNDYGFNKIFSRQLQGLATKGDIFIGISTSGNSENIIEAVKSAKEIGLVSVGFLGKDGGILKDLVNYPIVIPSNATARIQEAHIMIGHIICELVEFHEFSI